MTTYKPAAHLVGSVPLENAEAVFRAVTSMLDGYVARIPDGETGERAAWIAWQGASFANNEAFEDVPAPITNITFPRSFQIRPGIDPSAVRFPNLGFADKALVSYATFARLQAAGEIPASTRFQVSLATPPAMISRFVTPRDQAAVEPAYERALLADLARICAGIPHRALAIQWDVAYEISMWERADGHPALQQQGANAWFEDVTGGVIERLARYGDAVPNDVELGYHLCYGDRKTNEGTRGIHFVQPRDARVLVDVLNRLFAVVKHQIAWVHIPVPVDRTDGTYYVPLAGLCLPAGTQLFLGLVHDQDGVQGTLARIAVARGFVPDFGIAMECGFGRRPPESIPALLDVHREVCDRLIAGKNS
jgi:hypothetical protein